MDKVNDILTKLSATLQMVVGTLINLCFQPLFAITAIIDGTIEIWSPATNTNDTEAEKTNVYPEPAHIKGFQTNQSEVDQIEEIKRQLNGE